MIKIRVMTWEDLNQAAEIEAACFRQNWSKKMLEEGFLDAWNMFLAAEESGQLIGYGTGSVIAGEGEILRIAVLEGFRHKGIGRKLLEELVRTARERGAKEIALEVRESNLAARRLYRSSGFHEEARRKNYYREPREDAIIMWNRNL